MAIPEADHGKEKNMSDMPMLLEHGSIPVFFPIKMFAGLSPCSNIPMGSSYVFLGWWFGRFFPIQLGIS